jgi:hypothetical protein
VDTPTPAGLLAGHNSAGILSRSIGLNTRPSRLSLLPLVLALAAVLPVPAADASPVGVDVHCDIDSPYDVTANERSLIMTRATGTPRAIVMRQGRLFVDDEWVELGAADRDRIARFEQGMRASMPLAQALGAEAVDIAFAALGEVAAGFSSDPKSTQATLDRARRDLDARLSRSVSAHRFDDEALGDAMGEAVKDIMPTLIGDIVGGALASAFGGDTRRLRRMENLDAQIEASIEPRARALEARAQELCRRMEALDRIDDELEYRHQGHALELIEARVVERPAPAPRSGEKPAAERESRPR